MQLLIEGQRQTFVPIHTFRQQWHLPDEFGLIQFETKDWEVGRLDDSQQALVAIKQQMLAAVPSRLSQAELLSQVRQLAAIFRGALEMANDEIGLRDVEIDFAVDGFHNILHDMAYHLFGLSQQYPDATLLEANFDFSTVYQTWLDASTRLLTTAYTYTHNGNRFDLRVIYTAYGRIGLQIKIAGETYYVYDNSLACPAANYMGNLTKEVTFDE